ncbi:MAG: alpha-L-fucosidase [Treponema sp.]|jgi:alpha-L-fucosidase|nr:alpha-L-fucosidase [Treponema sp.]
MEYTDIVRGMADLERSIAQGPYTDDWNSLCAVTVPQWFRDAKFGIFIHWGVFSVPAYSNEWYPRNMYIKGMPAYTHHIKTYGPQQDFGYKDFIPLYTMEQFDPHAWAKVFKDAGARYVMPLAEHHDGFQMYASAISRFNAVEMGPHRDLLGALRQAVLDEGLVFGTSSHRAEHWFFLGHGKEFDSDIREPLKRGDFYWPAMPEPDNLDLYSEPYPTDEYLHDWLLRTCEIIDRYQPQLLYFDWWIQHRAFKPYIKKLAAYYYNQAEAWGTGAALCYKYDGLMFGSGIVEIERGACAACQPYPWQIDTPVAQHSWCYVEDQAYKKSVDIIRELVNVVSKNGNLLLNIGPRADGIIPEGDMGILRDIGAWLRVNGEAIYGSRPWRICSEGPTQETEGFFQDNDSVRYTAQDFRFTCKGDSIYAIALEYPQEGAVIIRSFSYALEPSTPSFRGIIRDVSIVGSAEKPLWKHTGEGLSLTTRTISSEYPVVIKITIE